MNQIQFGTFDPHEALTVRSPRRIVYVLVGGGLRSACITAA